jgi:ABC-type transport system substrate-binding protein
VWVSDEREPADVPEAVAIARYLVQVLNEIGLQAELEIVHDREEYVASIYFPEPGSERYQVYVGGWGQTYSGAGGFIDDYFRCGIPSQAPVLCTDRLDRAIDRAQALQGADPPAAHAAWVEIEHSLVEQAVIAPLMNPVSAYVFSDRVENVQVHPQWGILLSQLWVR